MTRYLQLGIEEVIEGGVRESGASAVRELLHSPVLQGRLFIVQEDTPVLDCWRAVRAARRFHKEFRMGRGRDVRPP